MGFAVLGCSPGTCPPSGNRSWETIRRDVNHEGHCVLTVDEVNDPSDLDRYRLVWNHLLGNSKCQFLSDPWLARGVLAALW